MNARAVLPVVGIFAVVTLTRLPFAADHLWAWDSVLYARALERGFHVDFEISEQRPHPPGYILYLAVASVFRALGADTNLALVLVSMVASGIGAAAVFALARRFAGAGPALVAAAGYAFAPLPWLYSSIAYPYTLLGALSIVLASVFWHARALGFRWWAFASVSFGLSAGFRQDLLLLLAPVWVWMLWRAGWRERLAAAACVGGGMLVWLVPTVALSDGPAGYAAALAQQTDQVRSSYSIQAQGLEALSYNVRFTVFALAWGLMGFSMVLAGVALAHARLRRASRGATLGPRGHFVAAWLLPAAVFYAAVHIGEWGYVLSVLPGLYVLAALAIAQVSAALGPRPRRAWGLLTAVMAVAPAFTFVTGGHQFTGPAIAHRDRALEAKVAYVRETFAPERTIVLAREDFLLVRHYLPAYRAWLYDPEPYGGTTAKRKKAMRATTIVIFTSGLRARSDLAVRTVEVRPGVHLSHFPLEAGEVLEFSGERFMVREPQ